MAKMYHTNTETGVTSVCPAKSPATCRLKAPELHAPTQEEARTLYEQSMENEEVAAPLSKPVEHSVDHVVWEDRRPEYTLTENAFAKAEEKLEKVNKRLARYGFEERFELDVLERDDGAFDQDGITLYNPTMKVALNRPQIARDGYSFEASVTTTPDGKLVVAPSSSGNLDREQVPASQGCDHCQANRHREKTYLIRNPEGELHQVGSTCIDAYMGVKVQGLWALELDPLKEDDGTLHDEEDEAHYRGMRYQEMPRDSEEMMAYVLAVSDEGKNFVSRSREMYSGDVSTATQIEHAIWSRSPEDSSWQNDIQEQADQYIQKGEAAAMLKKVQEEASKRDGEYWMNVQSVTSGEMVHAKHMGIFASAVGVLHKEEVEKKRQEAEKASYVPGFAGEEKERIKDRRGKIKNVSHFTSYNSYTRQDEERSVITFTDEKGREMVWFSSKHIDDAEIGAEVQFTGGSIKEHKQYEGRDQTVLTRVKFKEADDA